MPKLRRQPLFIFLALLAVPFRAQAETVELRDGRVFEGELVSETVAMMTIRESAGDGYIEAVYEKEELKKFGARNIEEELKTPGLWNEDKSSSGDERRDSPSIDFESRQRQDYENAVMDLADRVNRLQSLWNINRYDYEGFRQWFLLYEPAMIRFKDLYGGKGTVITFSMMNMAFQELGHFSEAVRDMEKVSSAYEKSVNNNASLSWRQRFQACLSDNERIAKEALAKTQDYMNMAKTKMLRR